VDGDHPVTAASVNQFAEVTAVGDLIAADPTARPDVLAARILTELIRRGWQPPAPAYAGPLRVRMADLADRAGEPCTMGGNPRDYWMSGRAPITAGAAVIAYDPQRMEIADATVTVVGPDHVTVVVTPGSVRRVDNFEFPVRDDEWHP
jgi:hypothetical protein